MRRPKKREEGKLSLLKKQNAINCMDDTIAGYDIGDDHERITNLDRLKLLSPRVAVVFKKW